METKNKMDHIANSGWRRKNKGGVGANHFEIQSPHDTKKIRRFCGGNQPLYAGADPDVTFRRTWHMQRDNWSVKKNKKWENTFGEKSGLPLQPREGRGEKDRSRTHHGTSRLPER